MQPKGREGALVRAFASPQCGPGSNPGVDAICGFSLLLVLSFAPRGFCPGSPVSPSPPPPLKNQHFQISNFDQESGRRRTTLWMCYLRFIIYLYLYIQLCWLCKKGCFTKVSQHFCPSLITGYWSFYTKSVLLQVSQWLLMNLLAATSCVIFFCVAVKYSFIVLILSASNFWPVSQHKYVFITVF